MGQLGARCAPPTDASTINKLEKGKTRLTQDWMRRLADALEVSPLDLLDGGPARLAPDEQDLVDTYRGMSEDQRQAFLHTAKALAGRKGTSQ